MLSIKDSMLWRDVTGREGNDAGDTSWIRDLACECAVWITVQHTDNGLVEASRCVLNPDILPCNSPPHTSPPQSY
jgi:hypothetical protein